MNRSHREPTLDEILSDSIVRALMEAGVDPQDLAATLRLTGGSWSGERVHWQRCRCQVAAIPRHNLSFALIYYPAFPGRGP